MDNKLDSAINHIKDGLRLVTPACNCGSSTCEQDAEVLFETVALRVLDQYTDMLVKVRNVVKSELN
jgi:hypothetical protein